MGVSRAYLRRGSKEDQVKMKAKITHSVARQRPVNISSKFGVSWAGGGDGSGQELWMISRSHTPQMLRPQIDSFSLNGSVRTRRVTKELPRIFVRTLNHPHNFPAARSSPSHLFRP